MARLAVAAVLLVALCRVIDGEVDQVAASPYYPFEPPEEEAVLPDGAYVEYNGAAGTSIAFVPPYLDGADRDEAAAAEATSPEGAVSPVDYADQQGFLRFPCRYHCRYRHMQWARHHGGLYRRHGEGFHGKEGKQLVAEMPVEPATHSEELREEAVVVPVAEPDPDSRQDDAAFAADEPVRGEEEDEDEMARFHHGRRSHHHHRHHRHHDEHEEDDHEQADEASPVERFRFHHHRLHHHHHHEEDEHEQREEGAPMKRFRHHHHHDDMRTSKRFHHHHRDKDVDSDDEDELEEMAKRWIRKALMRSSKILHHHGHRFRHRAAGAAAGEEEEEKGGVMSWLKDFVNRF